MGRALGSSLESLVKPSAGIHVRAARLHPSGGLGKWTVTRGRTDVNAVPKVVPHCCAATARQAYTRGKEGGQGREGTSYRLAPVQGLTSSIFGAGVYNDL